MPIVKLTLFRDPVEVPEDEIPMLRAQGLLEEEPAQEQAEVSAKPAAKATQKKEEQL